MSDRKPLNILFLGHSLVEFFDWQERFPDHNVVNLGVAGETVEGLMDRIGYIAKKYPQADMIFVMTGANNIAMEDYDFMSSYERIIVRLCSSYPEAKIYVHRVLPIILEWVPGKKIEEINELIRLLAERTGVEYLDMYRYFVDGDGNPIKGCLLDDGVHLSDTGYEVWAEVLEGMIST